MEGKNRRKCGGRGGVVLLIWWDPPYIAGSVWSYGPLWEKVVLNLNPIPPPSLRWLPNTSDPVALFGALSS